MTARGHSAAVGGLLALLLVTLVTVGARIAGVEAVTAGDTLRIGPERIRFHGIHALQSVQRCPASGATWPGGAAAMRALRERLAVRPVECVERDSDRYGPTVTVCRVDGADLNAGTVSQGCPLCHARTLLSRSNTAQVDLEGRS